MSVVVASAKGGVGKSSFCAGVGKMLASHNRKTLLVDMDTGARSLDILLGVAEKTVYNWGDVLDGNCDVHKAIIPINQFLSLIAAPIGFSENYTPDSLKKMISFLEREYEFILLDAPAGTDNGFNLCAGCADGCIIVSTPDPVSIRAASGASSLVRKFGIQNVRLVINRFNKKSKFNNCVDDYIDDIGAQLLGIIPESNEIFAFSNGYEIPYDCKGNLAFLRISKRMCGENIPFRLKNI